jgi:hypothetical protein
VRHLSCLSELWGPSLCRVFFLWVRSLVDSRQIHTAEPTCWLFCKVVLYISLSHGKIWGHGNGRMALVNYSQSNSEVKFPTLRFFCNASSMNFTYSWPYLAHGRDRGKSGNRLRRWCESLPRQGGPAVVARPARGWDLGAGAPRGAAGNPRPEHLMAAPSFAV